MTKGTTKKQMVELCKTDTNKRKIKTWEERTKDRADWENRRQRSGLGRSATEEEEEEEDVEEEEGTKKASL